MYSTSLLQDAFVEVETSDDDEKRWTGSPISAESSGRVLEMCADLTGTVYVSDEGEIRGGRGGQTEAGRVCSEAL